MNEAVGSPLDLSPIREEDSRAPSRIQRKRTKGWRMPEGAVYVGRPTIWGNPFTIASCIENGFADNPAAARVLCVEAFGSWRLTDFAMPISELVDLARKYTPEQWRAAAFKAAANEVDEACLAMAKIAAR